MAGVFACRFGGTLRLRRLWRLGLRWQSAMTGTLELSWPVSHSDFQVRSPAIENSIRVSRAVSAVAACYAIVGGAITLFGWAFDIQRLTDWNNEAISMFANTAACVVLGGVALLLLAGTDSGQRRRTAVRVLAVIIASVGALTLVEHLFDVNFGIDTLLFNRPWGQRASAAPMRMGLPASTSLLTVGSGILLATFSPSSRRIAGMLGLGVVSIVSLSLIGYWFGADQLFIVPKYTGIAWQTSTMIAALGIGLVAALPQYGVVAILRRDDAGGELARKLMVPIIGVPLLLGWLGVVGQDAGLYDTAFGTAVRTLVEIILLFGMLWWTADGLSRQAMIARAAEQALRESEMRFRIMADAAPVLIWMSGADRRRTWFNKRWLEFVGQPMESEIGSGWIANVHPDDSDRCRDAYLNAFDARQTFAMEYRLRRRDGEYRWVLDNGIPRYESNGEFAGYIGSCVDITERKQIEEAAKEAARRKDEFLATLAHELRNPLAPIGNALEIIKHADGNSGILEQARDTMERQFGQMVRLVDDLLDIGRITRDKLELRLQRVELASVLHQAVETSRSLADAGKHELRVTLPSTPIWIHGDPVRLAQVFSNLLNNACKFTESEGAISITAERRDAEVAITVRDTGIGIAPEKLESIFEMFAQVDQTLERTRSGLGIGLTLVKRLVELHGGRIVAKSEGLGRGSEFAVHLPVLADNAVPAQIKVAPGVVTTTPQRILVTDDNQDAADSVAMLLRLSGHEVETAYDGLKAFQKAEAYKPDIMLLDIGLPGMNGYEVCRSIRQQPWGKDIRIVALTGWGQDQDRRIAREAGFDDHLVKPVDPQTLRRAIAPKSSP